MKQVSKWQDKRFYAAALIGLGMVGWAYVNGNRAITITFLVIEIAAFIGYALLVPDESPKDE